MNDLWVALCMFGLRLMFTLLGAIAVCCDTLCTFRLGLEFLI